MKLKSRHKTLAWVILMVVLLLAACGKSSTPAWQEQYDLGMQYLTEGDYSAAIVAFTAAIEIEPKRATLYIARGDAYIAWAEETKDIALDAVKEGEFLAWADISTEDGSYSLQELHDNAQSDYEKAVDLLENGGAEEQSDDLLEEARQKLEEAKTKQEDGKDELARELIELAERLLEDDPSDEEKKLADECLEAASEHTDDEELIKQIEELQDLINGEDDSTQVDDNSVVQDEDLEEEDSNLSAYTNIEECTEEEQATIISLVEAAQSGDLDSLPQLTEIPEVTGYFYYDGYKVQITRGYDYEQDYVTDTDGYWWPYMIVSVRPKEGTGYSYFIWEDLEGSSVRLVGIGYFRVTDYIVCSCENWDWNGEFTRNYRLSVIPDKYSHIGFETGNVVNNSLDGTVNGTYTTDYSSYSWAYVYENGVLISSSGDDYEWWTCYCLSEEGREEVDKSFWLKEAKR